MYFLLCDGVSWYILQESGKGGTLNLNLKLHQFDRNHAGTHLRTVLVTQVANWVNQSGKLGQGRRGVGDVGGLGGAGLCSTYKADAERCINKNTPGFPPSCRKHTGYPV